MSIFNHILSGRNTVKKLKKLFFAAGMVMMAAGLFAGCGKSKKSSKEDRVIHISTAPEPTATPDPQETDPDAVTVNGNLTMVNEYLVDNPGAAPGSVTATPEATGDGASDSSSDRETDSSDSGDVSDETDNGASYDEGDSADTGTDLESDEGDSSADSADAYDPEDYRLADQEDGQDEE